MEKSLRKRALDKIAVWAQVRESGRLKSVGLSTPRGDEPEGVDEAAATFRFVENVIKNLNETAIISDLFSKVLYENKPLHDIRPNSYAANIACGRFLAAVQKAIDLDDKTKPKAYAVVEEFTPIPDTFKNVG